MLHWNPVHSLALVMLSIASNISALRCRLDNNTTQLIHCPRIPQTLGCNLTQNLVHSSPQESFVAPEFCLVLAALYFNSV